MAFFKGAAKEATRAAMLTKQREKERHENELQKKRLEAELKVGDITNKFTVHYDAVEHRLRSDTVGLVTLDEMRAKQEEVVSAREKQLASTRHTDSKLTADQKKHQRNLVKRKGVLSFSFDDEEENEEEEEDKEDEDEEEVLSLKEVKEEDETVSDQSGEGPDPSGADDVKQEPHEASNGEPHKKRKRLGKNPNVDTSFLPDIDRDEEENRLREELRREWVSKQQSIKEEEIEITYSYWDGSGHRRTVRMKKGNTIGQMLHRCLEQLRKEFPELRSSSHDQLMYVKEDLIIPHHHTFYDFIVTKARGKSGPLFHFDAHEEVRLRHDASVEKEESHAGKVCLRSWYERHKHIFPASRWEPYDPTKNWDRYSISDKMAAKITIK